VNGEEARIFVVFESDVRMVRDRPLGDETAVCREEDDPENGRDTGDPQRDARQRNAGCCACRLNE